MTSNIKKEDIQDSSQSIQFKKSLDSLTKEIAKGGGITFIGYVIGKISNFGLHILLGNVLGPGSYGLYALGISILQIAKGPLTAGFKRGVVRFCSMYRVDSDPARIKGTILTALGITLLFSAVGGVIFFTFSPQIAKILFKETDSAWVFRIIAVVLPFYAVIEITGAFAQSFRRIDLQQIIINIFRPLVTLAMIGLAFLFGFRLGGALFGFLIAGVLTAGIGLYFTWYIFPEILKQLGTIYETERFVLFSLPLCLASLPALLIINTDRIMLGMLSRSEDVGIYNSAFILTLQLTFIFQALNNIFLPMIANLHERGLKTELAHLFRIITKWIFTLTLPVFLILILFPRTLLGIWGSKFITGWPVLLTLAIAQFINVSVGPASGMLIMRGKEKLVMMNSIVVSLLNILLNYIFIQIYGLIGAAIATGLSISLINVVKIAEVYYFYRIHPYSSSYLKPITAGFIAVMSWLGVSTLIEVQGLLWILGVMTISLVYLGTYILLGMEVEDRLIIRAVKNRLIK